MEFFTCQLYVTLNPLCEGNNLVFSVNDMETGVEKDWTYSLLINIIYLTHVSISNVLRGKLRKT